MWYKWFRQHMHWFFMSNDFLQLSLTASLIFSWIGLQMLLRCCLIHISVIMLRHFLYLLYLCPCLDLGLFMSYICDLFFIVIFIFIMINCISQEYRDTYSFDYFYDVSYYFWTIWTKNANNFQIAKVQSQGVA